MDLSKGGNLVNSKCEIKLSNNDHGACRHHGSGRKHLVSLTVPLPLSAMARAKELPVQTS